MDGLDTPDSTHCHRRHAAADHQAPIELQPAACRALCGEAHRPGKSRHGNDRAHGKRNEIAERLGLGRKREHRQYSQKVGTAGETMQNADAESGVRVMVRGLGRVGRLGRMQVNMHMAFITVFMFVRVNLVLQRLTQTPQSDADQHNSHDEFAP